MKIKKMNKISKVEDAFEFLSASATLIECVRTQIAVYHVRSIVKRRQNDTKSSNYRFNFRLLVSISALTVLAVLASQLLQLQS
jgi:hypothetical protein